ncbi:hypothetical protein ACU4GI_19205 [Cupriavidus basilensis]|uniref:hypothetical protein n=1 Tax=Cupriavidus TaxID=106589 RepID=UPI00044EA8CE|nr:MULTISPECIES: hypothetical protein [Cupriavidus]KDP89144.1 hypothetical protein CF70_019975 [Cupriavidus sp. SK-3]KJK22213.1 hypothetical protein UB46_22970 [Burkholderiaceae bacterium 16]MDF3881499.1 hypothetical protein [Cupriavidus basilensis]
MTRIAKVILKSTSGDEYSCSVHYEPDADVVTLPVRLDNLVDASIAMGERHVLLLLEDGYQFPLVRMEPAVYNVDRSKAAKRGWMDEARMAVAAPTKDQRLQYGRFAHTLSAAAILGLAGYLTSRPGWNLTAVANGASLFGIAVVLFAVGAVLSKGEK